MTKSWTQLIGRSCDEYDSVYDKEIIRPTKHFTISPFGKRQYVFEIVAVFENNAKASNAFQEWKKEPKIKTTNDNIFTIGTSEGNQIEIDSLGKDEYRLICRDHFSQNFVDYYVHRNDLVGLMEFIRKYLENN